MKQPRKRARSKTQPAPAILTPGQNQIGQTPKPQFTSPQTNEAISPLVNVAQQREAISNARKFLDTAREKYATTLIRFQQTRPTDPAFSEALDMLEAISYELVMARDNFIYTVANI